MFVLLHWLGNLSWQKKKIATSCITTVNMVLFMYKKLSKPHRRLGGVGRQCDARDIVLQGKLNADGLLAVSGVG